MRFTIDNEEYVDLEELEKIMGMKQTLIYEKMRYKASKNLLYKTLAAELLKFSSSARLEKK
jgi:predicted DNA-binding transcriptional regulator AlpA